MPIFYTRQSGRILNDGDVINESSDAPLTGEHFFERRRRTPSKTPHQAVAELRDPLLKGRQADVGGCPDIAR